MFADATYECKYIYIYVTMYYTIHTFGTFFITTRKITNLITKSFFLKKQNKQSKPTTKR